MTIVNIQARRDAFRTKGRLDDGPGASFDQNPRIDDDKDMPPGHDDQARFARLVLPHLGDAYSLARWITGSRADAEDVVQDACLRAFRAIGGCGQLLMFWKGGNAILVDFLPELVPPAFGEDEGSQAEDDLSALWGPAHSRTTQPLFDQSFACGLCDA